MDAHTAELADLLEEEIAVGEELERNLAAQKKALIGWDVSDLLEQVAAREPWLRTLGELEIKRKSMLHSTDLSKAVTLAELLAQLPKEAPETERLRCLRKRGREIFLRLEGDERSLHELMENLLAHIQEALQPLLSSTLPLYSETGTAAPVRPASALIHNKA